MNTEMKDIHFSRHADRVAAQIRFSAPAFRLTRWEAFVGAVVAFFGASKANGVVAPTLAIVLSLASIGCAGLAPQHASTLVEPTGTGQRHSDLWMSADPSPPAGLAVVSYAGGDMGLWNQPHPAAEPRTQGPSNGSRATEPRTDSPSIMRNQDPHSDTCTAVPAGSLLSHVYRSPRSRQHVQSSVRPARSGDETFASRKTEL